MKFSFFYFLVYFDFLLILIPFLTKGHLRVADEFQRVAFGEIGGR